MVRRGWGWYERDWVW
jgi:hypothetical protein